MALYNVNEFQKKVLLSILPVVRDILFGFYYLVIIISVGLPGKYILFAIRPSVVQIIFVSQLFCIK